MSNEVDPTSILDLPTELHISISQHLAIRPRDILSVLKTCRTLHSVYSQKSVWADALRVVCQRDALFGPSYPIQSMTVAQLQRAAMGPDLWNRRLRAGEPFVDADVQTQVTTSDNCSARGAGGGKTRVYFAPGGRYLFEQGHGAISLWDLGFPVALRSDADVPPKSNFTLVDRIVGQGIAGRSPVVEFAVHASSDGEQLRLWTATTPSPSGNGEHMTRLSVYEIRPSDTKPKFREISSIDASVWSLILGHCDLAMTTRLAIIHSFDLVFIWDFMSNSYSIWNLNQTQQPNDLLFLSHNSLVMVKEDGALAWDIPIELDFQIPPSRSIDFSKHCVGKPSPTHRVTYGEGNLHKPLAWTFSHWYSSLDLPTLFDVEEQPERSESESESLTSAHAPMSVPNLTRVSRFQLNIGRTPPTQGEVKSGPPPKAASESKQLRASHLRRLETIHLPLTPESYHFLHRISGDVLLSFYNNCKPGYHFGIIYSPFSASPDFPELRANSRAGMGLREGEDYGIVGMNLDWESARSHSLTFCSASGRVACVVKSPGPGKTCIKLFDFSGNLVG